MGQKVLKLVAYLFKYTTKLYRTNTEYHTVKSTVRRMNTPVLIPCPTWGHTIFSCLWTVLLFLTWLYTRFWLYTMQKLPFFEKHSLSLQTRPVICFVTIYNKISLIHESRMTILSSTLNRIESRRFISEKISAELDIQMKNMRSYPLAMHFLLGTLRIYLKCMNHGYTMAYHLQTYH